MDFHSPKPIFLTPFLWLGFRNFGWAGVDIFFVLSGFLVGGLLIKEWKEYRRIDAGRFLIRRGFKIWPQYYLFLLANLVTRHRTLHQLWGNLLNIQNYVGGIAHTWSLAVEEHAYLILVAVLAFAARRKVRISLLCLHLCIACGAIFLWRLFLAGHGVDTFPRTDTRIDGILYGLLLAILYHYRPAFFAGLQQLRYIWSSVIVAALLFLRVAPPDRWWFGSVACAYADATGVALLLLLYHHQPDRKRPVVYRLVAWIGFYSYGIYLWHVAVMGMVTGVANRRSPHLATALEFAGPLAFGIAAGVATTKLVELPALKLRDRLFPKRVDSPVDPARLD